MSRQKGTPKTGGRQKGTPNRANAKRQDVVAKTGQTPLEYLLEVMRNAELPATARMDAAKAAAPYVHPKLANVELGGPDGGPLQVQVISFADSEDTE